MSRVPMNLIGPYCITEDYHPMNDVTDYYPYATDGVLPQDKSQEKRVRLTVSPESTISNQHPLHREANQYRKPHEVDVKTV